MVRSLEPDLSVHISRRRWRCVVDPHLCLSHDGAAFIRGLAGHAEIWLGPEFLNILDSWLLYDREPSALMWSKGGSPDADEVRQALRIWQGLRDTAGPGSGRLCWVRDAVRESCLPPGMDESLVPQWEAMAEALDGRLSRAVEASGPMVAATRDAAALTALLPGSVLLCRGGQGDPPLCHHLKAWHLPCRRLELVDDLVSIERGLLMQMLVEAGLAGFLWGGLRLVVVHIVAPGHSRLPLGHDFANGGEDGGFLAELEPRPVKGAWEDALAFWYDLAGEDYRGKWSH
ncbi:hypothetical protein [Acidisphaera sp. S103]|uniref:hypothetical protein n=1 Tax=Acidisphaera sp. S103 TaxID=1747223 RepID=UPI00131D89FD|nr:hypothetical protein [Acidisphaera sp. S103]